MVASLFISGADKVIVDATNMTRERRRMWFPPRVDATVADATWTTWWKVFPTEAAECIRRATEGGREDLIPIIKSMSERYEALSESANLWSK